MKGLVEAVKGMRLMDTEAISEQGKKAYRFGMTLGNNPMQADTAHKIWENGWNNARVEWESLLRRNGGYLGMRGCLQIR